VLHPRREPLRGAYCALPLLTSARFAADDLDLPSLLQAQSAVGGGHRSRVRGRGLEFEEVRAYQAGDDIRNIDWRVTARSGRPFTKLFREERERPLLLLVDQRQSMFFGSRTCFKSVTAAYLGALIAWAGLRSGDRIGGIVLGNAGNGDVRPRHTRAAAMTWLQQLHDFNHRLDAHTAAASDPGASLANALMELRRSARPGSALILISDFDGADDPRVGEQLHRLAQHNALLALRIFDPLERELPPPARYTFTGNSASAGAARLTLDSGDKHLRAQHRDHFSARTELLNTLFGGLGTRPIDIATDAPPLAALTAVLSAKVRS
jgi:uncharacterized protein (DUF58 family)